MKANEKWCKTDLKALEVWEKFEMEPYNYMIVKNSSHYGL